MSAKLIDSLLVELKLQADQFIKKQQEVMTHVKELEVQTQRSLNKTEANQDKAAAVSVEQGDKSRKKQRQTTEELKKTEIQSDQTRKGVERDNRRLTDSFSFLTKEVLKLGAAYLGFEAIKRAASNLINKDVGLGVQAPQINLDAQKLKSYGDAFARLGASAQDATALFNKLGQLHQLAPLNAAAFVNPKTGLQSVLGIDYGTFFKNKDPEVLLKEVRRGILATLAAGKLSTGEISQVLYANGFSTGEVAALTSPAKGPNSLEAIYAQQMKINVNADQAAQAALKLNNALQKLKSNLEAFGNTILVNLFKIKDEKIKFLPPSSPSPLEDKLKQAGKEIIGLMNNNPGNLKFAAQAGALRDGFSSFAVFRSEEAGIDAMARQLQAYARGGKDTIREIVSTYAPAKDHNNTEAYIKFIKDKLGVSDTAHLSIDKILPQETLKNLIIWMTQMETGFGQSHAEEIAAVLARDYRLSGTVNRTTHDVTIHNQIIHTQATDAKGIMRDASTALLAAQANTGVQ